MLNVIGRCPYLKPQPAPSLLSCVFFLYAVNLGALMLKALFEFWPSTKSPEPDNGMSIGEEDGKEEEWRERGRRGRQVGGGRGVKGGGGGGGEGWRRGRDR